MHILRESSSLQLECLLCGEPSAPLDVRVRFLQLATWQAFALREPQRAVRSDDPRLEPVDLLNVDGELYLTRREATERRVHIEISHADLLTRTEIDEHFAFDADEVVEVKRDSRGLVVGKVVCRHHAVSGIVRLFAARLRKDTWRLSIVITNDTPVANAGSLSRVDAETHALACTHAILSTRGAHFVSLKNPPADLAELAAECRNEGVWPVLIGEPGSGAQLLAAPIMLDDFPHPDLWDPGSRPTTAA